MTTGEDDVAARIGDAHIALTNRCPITAQTIEACPNLKQIISFGTGYNQIALDAANARGITVCNIPGYGRGAVAQMAIALLFSIVRKVDVFDHYVKTTGWNESIDPNICAIRQFELSGKTIGILGMGDIGYAVARVAMAMDMNVLAYQRTPKKELECDQLRYCSLDELYEKSDIISVHCPLTDQTRGLVNAEAIAKMKDGVIVINTARGPVVDEDAVIAALDSGKLYAYGTDVFCTEPCADSPIVHHPRCVATPHVAWMPEETRARVIAIAADNIAAFLAGKSKNAVN
jgi:glycerate dehydrogenase